MIGLLFKILGDSSGFRKEMDKTRKDAGSGGQVVGKVFGEQFKAGMMRYIGAGAILSAFTKAVRESVEIAVGSLKMSLAPESVQELTKAAEMLGMSVDELQQVAPSAASEFETLMKTIRDGGGIVDEDTVNILAYSADKFQELWAEMQPIMGATVKSLAWLIGQGERVASTYAGFGMAAYGSAKRMITGNSDIQQAGVELVRDAANENVVWGASPRTSERRAAAKAMVARLRANREMVVQAQEDDRLLSRGFGEIPLVGDVASDLVQTMWKVAEEQKKTREEIAKRL